MARSNVKNERQYEALKDKGMSKWHDRAEEGRRPQGRQGERQEALLLTG